MDIFEVTILHHVCIVLLLLWVLSSVNCCHPAAYFISLLYLYLVHERYITRLRRKLRFEERRNSNQRRVLSDSETVRWLNYLVEKIWPVCMEQIVSQKILLPIIPWFLQKYKPWTVSEAVVQHLYMGRSPPIVTEMRVLHQPTGDDHLVMELGMNFCTADDMSAILAAKLTKRLGFGMWTKLHLMGMHVEGKVLVGVKFLHHWPFLGRLRVCFVEPPYFQMTVKPIFTHGIDVTELPGIAGWLDNLLAVAFEQTLVQPNMLVVDMEKFVTPQPGMTESWFSVDEKEPVAYALVEVIEGANMQPSDLNGLADPYVKGELGPYRFRTKTQKKTLAPKWHQEFKVPIFTWESPNILAIEVHDKDHFVDDALGDCSISIDKLRDGQRHDMWLPLENIKMGRLHLAITVVEGNKKAPDQSFDTGTVNDDNERNSLAANDTNIPEKPQKVADTFDPIDIEGQDNTGIWVHHPGSEVSQVWEPRKGKSRLGEAPMLVVGTGSFKSTASGACNDDADSSSDGSQEGINKGNQPNKVQRGLHKIGSLFQRSSKKEDASNRIEEELGPSPHANLKAVSEEEIGVNLNVDDNLSVLSPVKNSKAEDTRDSPKGSGLESPSKGHVKDMAKNILKHTFSRKHSKKPLGDSGTVGTARDIPIESGSSDEGSVSSPVCDSGVEGIPVDSKPLSSCGGSSFKTVEVNEDPTNKVCVQSPRKIGEENDDLLIKSSSSPRNPEESSEASKK